MVPNALTESQQHRQCRGETEANVPTQLVEPAICFETLKHNNEKIKTNHISNTN